MFKTFLILALLLAFSSQSFADNKRPPQYVLISFDGSLSIPMWEATRELATVANADFTYYISGVYFLTNANKSLYKGPRRPKGGSSAIGFGGAEEQLRQRVTEVDAAVRDGNAISSHANGHFGGGAGSENWNLAEWTLEFDAFHWLLGAVFENNKITNYDKFTKKYWLELLNSQLRGFRAPQLSRNEGMYQTLGDKKYTYDSSQSGNPGYWPQKNTHGTWNMPLGYIPISGTSKNGIAMDYNFYMLHSKAKPDPANAEKYAKQTYQSYLNYFAKNYNGNRAPINIGHHFSTWNGGAYWKALTDFAKKVCSQPEVICTTFDQYEEYLESLTPEMRLAYSKAQFDISDRPVLPKDITGGLTSTPYVPSAFFNPLMTKLGLPEGDEAALGCTPDSHNEEVDVDLLKID